MRDYEKEKGLIEKAIEKLEKQVADYSKIRFEKITEYKKMIEDLKKEEKEQLKLLRKKFVEKVTKFSKEPTDEMMIELLDDLFDIKLSDMDCEYEEQFKLVKAMQPLFKYVYEKEDVELVEKYLLAKASTGLIELKEFEPKLVELKHHIAKGVYTYTDKSKLVMDGYCIFSYEMQEFMRLLGKIDYQKRPISFEGVYRSAEFEKYMLRAIAGVYGYRSKYIYCDGEFGHEDYERKCHEKVHDEGYMQAEKSSEISC